MVEYIEILKEVADSDELELQNLGKLFCDNGPLLDKKHDRELDHWIYSLIQEAKNNGLQQTMTRYLAAMVYIRYLEKQIAQLEIKNG